LEDEVEKYNLNINFRGSTSQLPEILPNFDAYIMPSLFEGFGIAPLEAMAVGIPVILSNIDVFTEIAGEVALFFNPYQVEDLVSILNKIISNEIDLYSNLSNAKNRVLELSEKENYLNKLQKIYLD